MTSCSRRRLAKVSALLVGFVPRLRVNAVSVTDVETTHSVFGLILRVKARYFHALLGLVNLDGRFRQTAKSLVWLLPIVAPQVTLETLC